MRTHAGRGAGKQIVTFLLASVSLLITVGCQANRRSVEWLGVNTNWLARVAGGSTAPLSLRDDLACLDALHIRHIREPLMDWNVIHPNATKNADFALCDDVVKQAQSAGTEILVVCPHIPQPAGANEPMPDAPAVETFRAWVRDFVERYDGDRRADMPGLRKPILHYELALDTQRIRPDAYASWAVAFAGAAKEACPKATLVLGGIENPGMSPCNEDGPHDPAYFSRLVEALAHSGSNPMPFDTIGFACFPMQCLPVVDPFNVATGYLRKVLADHHVTRPLWLTAYGQTATATDTDGQAADLVKWTLTARTLNIERMYLYALSDPEPGTRPRGPFGLTYRVLPDQPPIRRKAFTALSILADYLVDQPHVTYRRDGVYMLTGRSEPTFVVWEPEVYNPPPLNLHGWWNVRQLDGRTTMRNGRELKATREPTYLQPAASPFLR